MPDREKVIKGLECCSQMDGYACRKCPYASECVAGEQEYQTGTSHLASDALALLKEQKAVAPNVEVLNELDRLYRCPRCNKCFFYEHQKFCDQCGQEVKWK